MRMGWNGKALAVTMVLMLGLAAGARQARAQHPDIDRYHAANLLGLTVSSVGNASDTKATPALGGGTYQLNLAGVALFRDLNGTFASNSVVNADWKIDTVFGFFEVADPKGLPSGTKFLSAVGSTVGTGWKTNANPDLGGFTAAATDPESPSGDALKTAFPGSKASFSWGKAQTKKGSTVHDYTGDIFWGFHVRATYNGVQTTGWIYGFGNGSKFPGSGGPDIPEPAFYQLSALLGLGGLGLYRLRRRAR